MIIILIKNTTDNFLQDFHTIKFPHYEISMLQLQSLCTIKEVLTQY